MAPGYPAEAGYQLSGNLDLATVMFKANGENVTGMPEDNYVYNDVVGLYDFYFAGDTFTLPAGIYEALRITIGEGEGHNWWCVAFPSLCLSATSEEFADKAAGAGFPDSLTGALDGEEKYEVRFFLLDALGELEKFLYAG